LLSWIKEGQPGTLTGMPGACGQPGARAAVREWWDGKAGGGQQAMRSRRSSVWLESSLWQSSFWLLSSMIPWALCQAWTRRADHSGFP